MHWHSPNWLWILWLLPVVAWLLVRAQRKRQTAARDFAAGRMRIRLMPATNNGRIWTKGTLLIAGLALLILAAARPQYGVYYEQVAQRGVDLFVLLDVSRSMLAEDIAPNRLERAKSDIVDLLERLPNDRVGLLVFAGKPVLRVPLTNDHAFFRYMLREVDTDTAPIGGSLIGDAIRQALAAMEPRSDRDQVIVLITDGEDHDSFPGDAARAAAERGVKIIAVGLGDTNEGARIPIQNPKVGGGFVKDSAGQVHWSKMDEDLLKDLALTTSGAYVPARTMAYDLGQIYDDHLAGLTRGEIRTEKRRRFSEQFQWFAALGLALLVADWLLVRLRTRAPAMMALFIAAVVASSVRADDPSRQVRKGVNAFDAGDFATAAELFAAAANLAPDDPRITFNEGCAQAAQQVDEEAREFFYKSALARDTDLSAGSHYNLGSLAASAAQRELGADPLQADPEQRQAGLASLTRAAGHFRDALRMDPEHNDARHNLETIRLWMKQMKALWEERDREQQRNEQNLLQMLKDLDARQSALRVSLRASQRQAPSPLRQQGLDELEEQQRGLLDEVEPLKEKISTELSAAGQQNPAGGAPATGGVPTDELNQAIEVLHQWADELHDSFLRAANNIAAEELDDALQAQRESLETVNQMYVGLAPFPDLLQTALRSQQGLVDQSRDFVGVDTENESDAVTEQDDQGADKSAESQFDPDELAWKQRRIGGWANALAGKASQELPLLEQQKAEFEEAQAANSQEEDDDDKADDDTAAEPGEDDQPSDEVPDLEPMMESLRRAIELAPQVQTLALEAADFVGDGQFEPALPKQEEALKLLEKIAETLPKSDQSQNQQQQNQQQQNQQPNQEERQDDSSQQQDSSQHKQDDDNQESEQQDQSAQQSQKQQQDAGQQQQQSSGKQGQRQTEPGQIRMTPAQVEAILQRVRDRERQHRQVEKRMRMLLQKRVPPERDW